MKKNNTIEEAAQAVGCNPRTVRRHLAAGRLPGAFQQRTATGLAWRIPAAALDQLREHLAPQATLCEIETAPPAATPPEQPVAIASHQPTQGADALGSFAAVQVLRVALESQATTIAGQLAALEAAREDALWWRCEALELRETVDRLKGQLATATAELDQLRKRLQVHDRPTMPLDQIRRQLQSV